MKIKKLPTREEALVEYKRIEGPAWAEYKRIEGPAWAEYKRIQGPAWAEYKRTLAAIVKAEGGK